MAFGEHFMRWDFSTQREEKKKKIEESRLHSWIAVQISTPDDLAQQLDRSDYYAEISLIQEPDYS